MPLHSVGVTRPPTHWCAFSGETGPSLSGMFWVAWVNGFLPVGVVKLVFSCPPATKSFTHTWSYFGQGYGTPISSSKNAMISFVSRNEPAASWISDGGV